MAKYRLVLFKQEELPDSVDGFAETDYKDFEVVEGKDKVHSHWLWIDDMFMGADIRQHLSIGVEEIEELEEN